MNSERTLTNSKVKQRDYKKEIHEIKKTAQDMKELNKDMESLRKKESNRNSDNKHALKTNKKYH
jgi:hypothetical protein